MQFTVSSYVIGNSLTPEESRFLAVGSSYSRKAGTMDNIMMRNILGSAAAGIVTLELMIDQILMLIQITGKRRLVL
jgi:hypothetical protein